MILATLCYLKHNDHTLMLHRTKRADDIHAGKWNGPAAAEPFRWVIPESSI